LTAVSTAGTVGTIAGTVSDESGEPVVGASVVIEDTPYGSMTDENGEYYIPRLSAGSYTVTARLVGMAPMTKEGVTVVADQLTRTDFTLREAAAGRTVIEVKDQRSVILHDVPATVHVIDREEIGLMPVSGILDAVRHQPGIVFRRGAIHVRGGRPGEVAFLLDGIPMRSPVENTFTSSVPMSALSEMSVTTGGLGAEYGNAMSGIVNMVTREGGPRYEAELHLRGGDMTEIGWEDVARNYTEPSENDDFRSRCANVEATLGGPEPFSEYLLPAIGIDAPWDARFFGALGWLRSGRDLTDSRGFWENNWQNGLTGSMKVTARLSEGTKLSLLGHYFYRQNGWDEWAWSRYEEPIYIGGVPYLGEDLDYALPIRFREDYGYTLVLTQMVGDESYVDLKVNRNTFANWRRIRSEAGGYQGDDLTPPDWYGGYHPEDRVADSLGFYHSGVHPDVWLESMSKVVNGRFDLVTRFENDLELQTGVEGRYYDIYDYSVHVESSQDKYVSLWKAYPNAGGAYVQGSSRFTGGLVLNAGVRFDYFDPNTRKLSVEDGTMVDIPVKYQISPRIGMTHPISTRDVFFATYGHYFQMPNLNQLFFGTDYNPSGPNSIMGNPDLEAEQTISYELGLRHLFGELTSVAVSAFYKDITGLVRTAEQYSESYDYYYVYENDDSHGTVRGLEIKLLQLPGRWISGSLGYTYSIAKGRYSTPTEQWEYATEGLVIPPREDNYLDWDQTHTADMNLTLSMPQGSGPSLAGWRFLEGGRLTVDWCYGSGFPYSPPLGESEQPRVNTERYPWTMQTDVIASKRIPAGPLELEAGVTVYNLFNRHNVSRIFDTGHYISSGEPGGPTGNPGAWSSARHFLARLDVIW
jgi:outer membrane receptor protein involved in Fe transport